MSTVTRSTPATVPTRVRPRLSRIVRHSGPSGQVAYSVLATYPGDSAGDVLTFHADALGMVYLTARGRTVQLADAWVPLGTDMPAWITNYLLR